MQHCSAEFIASALEGNNDGTNVLLCTYDGGCMMYLCGV